MVIRTLERLRSLLPSALFAEVARVPTASPPQQRRSRRSSRRIVARTEHSSLADWFPAANAHTWKSAFSAPGA